MNTQFQRSMMLPTISEGALTLAARGAFRLSGDYSNSQTVDQPGWPAGMKELVNSRSRIDGQFAGAEDIFFFAGTAHDFGDFLKDYVKVRDVEMHRLILHRGKGGTGLLAGSSRRSCDWKLLGRPGASRYVMEVHFWTDGRIDLDRVAIPKGMEITNANLAVS